MRLIAYLGKEFGPHLDLSQGNHPYQNWINKYSSEGFQATTKQNEDLLDKLSVRMTGDEQEDIIENLYQQAVRIVVEFLHAQPIEQPTVVPLIKEYNRDIDRLMISSDFDLTCTVVDSSAILAELAITAPKTEQSPSELQSHGMLLADLKNTWNLLSKQYTNGYEECIENILKKEKVETLDYKGLCEALMQLLDFEKMANQLVIESGVLKGIRFKDVHEAGRGLIFQHGCTNFFRKVVESNETLDPNIHVISYCWSNDLILASFSAGMTKSVDFGSYNLLTYEKALKVFSVLETSGIDSVKIHANGFKYEELTDKELTTTGDIDRKIESPSEKFNSPKAS